MKKVNHTPGPWKVKAVEGAHSPIAYFRIESVNFDHPGGLAYASLPLRGKTKKQKELAGTYGSMGAELAKANAELIAAAPDLLEALKHAKAFIARMVQEIPTSELSEILKAGVVEMTKAIEKAEQP